MITLYGAPGSVFVRKVKIILLEKGIDFINKLISPLNRPLPESFLEISPLGKIPAMRDGDFSLADSSVISMYLDKKYPSDYCIMPDDIESQAKVLWFEEWADTKLFSSLAPFYYQTVLVPIYYKKSPDQDKIAHAKEQLIEVNHYLEKSLSGNEYLVANQFSLADIAIAGVYFNMHYAGFFIDQYCSEEIYNYLIRIFERPSFKACVDDILEDVERAQKILEHLKVSL